MIMTTNYSFTFLAGVAVATGFSSAIAGRDVPPYYNEETDTVVHGFVGHQPRQRTAMAGTP
jgi:hypothetical protein